jgi:hypothetical protein
MALNWYWDIFVMNFPINEMKSQGVVGVASAGSGYYVIALADTNVQQGALAGRLRSLGSHVREAFSQLD